MEEKKFCPYCGEKLVGDVRFAESAENELLRFQR